MEPSALDFPRRLKLIENPSNNISSIARSLFPKETNEQSLMLERYRPILYAPGNPIQGQTVFQKHCSNCHLRGHGNLVGPDLSSVKGYTKNQLLEVILDPSRNISPSYINYVVLTKNGQIYDGLLASETQGTLTLRRDQNQENMILRSNIREM